MNDIELQSIQFRGEEQLRERVRGVEEFEVPWDEALSQLEGIILERLTKQRHDGPVGSAKFLLKEMREADFKMMLAVVASSDRSRVTVIPLPYSYDAPVGVKTLDDSIFHERGSFVQEFNLGDAVKYCLEDNNMRNLRDPDIVIIMASHYSNDFVYSVGRPMTQYLDPRHKQWLNEARNLLNARVASAAAPIAA